MVKQIFVNLPINNLNKSVDFFKRLGFKFNPLFTDENATCMIIGENMYVMLLVEKFFKSFIPGKDIANASKNTEVLVALSAENREEVDKMIKNAVSAGGKEYREAADHGWMYGRAFQDLDGHIWEIFYMDESKMPEEMKSKGAEK
ncbi:glyoxalase/bleomycin resistance/extradiol dioxygenase family protein [Candidatus Woesearchaeota archaeon]|nr:glyoxalase/bleomycin resistance/extradiol dioxygenase family protein [Candidatus Woesearchaeota archaeon]